MINFFGGGVAASTGGGGVLDVEVPGITLQDDGVAVPNPPHIVFDFQGEGVTVNDLGAGVAQILIPGSAAYLPEQWFAEDLSTDRTDEPMGTRVSGFFETFVPVRSGYLVGMVSRLTEPMVDGTLTVEVTINGTLELSVTHTSVLNPTIGIATEAPGVIPYAAGDVIAVRYSTDADFAPTTQDVEVALSVFETL
jgi:hypothetical protein